MRVARTIKEVRQAVAEFRCSPSGRDGTVGLVPTMGYLHEGHLSLIHRAREQDGFTVLSIFVNPLQFGPGEDLDRYPRDEKRDLELAEKNGVDVAFLPDVKEMYPGKPVTTVTVELLTDVLCGKSRPGHFDGVATVVSKLFHIVGPEHAYFGLKDAQQAAVVSKMAEDLNMPVEIVPCPIVRESDGLAMSSRNVYLDAEQRSQATVLFEALNRIPEWTREAGLTAGQLRRRLSGKIAEKPLADIEYVEVLSYPGLQPVDGQETLQSLSNRTGLIAALAVRFGRTRLIDNRILPKKGDLT